jgi:dTDP-4-dehydrorhamnose reductase
MRLPADQLATPTHVDDLARAALLLAAQHATGIVHVAGPEFLSRMEFATLACSILSLDASRLTALPTAELGQKAARPLLGGLRIDKLSSLLGPEIMRAPAQGIRDWQDNLLI